MACASVERALGIDTRGNVMSYKLLVSFAVRRSPRRPSLHLTRYPEMPPKCKYDNNGIIKQMRLE